MESSRIFVKNLPPNITDVDFRKHFSAKGKQITDIKVIPRRRIGYVGYKTCQDAAEAVKYFNRSYIRMSKISVELAKPITDPSLAISHRLTTGQAIVAAAQEEASKPSEPVDDDTQSKTKNKKRKREDLDTADPKLQEFMETMRSGNKAISKAEFEARQHIPEPELDAEKLADLDRESDDEYEEIPSRPVNKRAADDVPAAQSRPQLVATPAAPPEESHAHPPTAEATADAAAREGDKPGATDDDWLRSRTNRTLDFADPDDLDAAPAPLPQEARPAAAASEEKAEEPVQEMDLDQPSPTEGGRSDDALQQIRKTSRLFLRNLPYSATEDEIREHMAVFGDLEEVHLAVGNAGASKGFAYVLFSNPSSAIDAFQKLDGSLFQGRLLHVLPALAKKEAKLDEFAISKLPLKKQNMIKKKAEAASSTFNWNALYMNQDAVNASIADRLGVSKAELLDPTSADAGVKQALAETSIIQETKAYFASNGVDLDAFKSLGRGQRGDTTILVKNFPYGTSIDELRKMFEEHGAVLRVLMPPSGTIAIVQFAQAPHARAAFASMAYRRIKDSVLFLEKGPKDLFKGGNSQQEQLPVVPLASAPKQKLSVQELLERDDVQDQAPTTSLFVRGLNFSTTTAKLAETFEPLDGFVSARVKTKSDPKKPGQVLSMGFGFVEFRTKEQAQAAQRAMDGSTLEGHSLTVKASHRGLDAVEERKREQKAKQQAGQRTKIVIKNLPFEATKKDVRQLFGAYGQLRAVRVPKSLGNKTRGFAFAEFTTPKEAENALRALGDTHLLGRRLVLDYAEAEALDAEEEIAKMQRKTERQVGNVALQGLLGRRAKRARVDLEGKDGEGDAE